MAKKSRGIYFLPHSLRGGINCASIKLRRHVQGSGYEQIVN